LVVESDSCHGEIEYVNDTSAIDASPIGDWAVPDWFSDPAVAAARQASWSAHKEWNRVANPPGSVPGEATPLARLLYNRMIESDVAYEVAKRAAQNRENAVPCV
jgi:hypothetical protein